MAAGIENIIPYSKDYKKINCRHGEAYFSIRTDFDFVMSLPDMEKKVSYTKGIDDKLKDRLNHIGIWLLFKYDIATEKISKAIVRFDVGIQVTYKEQQDIEEIVDMVIRERSRCNEETQESSK